MSCLSPFKLLTHESFYSMELQVQNVIIDVVDFSLYDTFIINMVVLRVKICHFFYIVL
jgi:hypothetical protein